MAQVVECPACGKKLKVPDDLLGKTVRCSDCAGTFLAAKPRAPEPPPPPDRPEAGYESRPSRRRATTPDGLMPHRGGLVLAFGIISIVGVLLSGSAVGIGGAAGVLTGGLGIVLAGGGIVFNIIGLVLGIMSWVWGGSDLKRMKGGIMDASGHGMTMGGYICGIIGTILNLLTLILECVAATVTLIFGAAIFGGFCCLFANASRNMPPPNQPFPNPPRRFQLSTGLPVKASDYLPAKPGVARNP